MVYIDEQRNDRLNISIADYQRFVEHKLKELTNNFSFKYGLQLTLFQSSNDHDNNFLNHLENPKWAEDYRQVRSKFYEPNKDKFGFYYLDMNSKKLTEVWK